MFLYAKEAKDAQMIARYGGGAPADWMERHVYTAFPGLGITFWWLGGEELLLRLQNRCQRAETSAIVALQRFAREFRCYG